MQSLSEIIHLESIDSRFHLDYKELNKTLTVVKLLLYWVAINTETVAEWLGLFSFINTLPVGIVSLIYKACLEDCRSFGAGLWLLHEEQNLSRTSMLTLWSATLTPTETAIMKYFPGGSLANIVQ